MKKILIAYCTKTNTTREIAEKISEVFTAKKLSCEVKAVSAVSDVSAYDSVVLGSPINGMRLLPELTTFITANPGLKEKAAALYAVSIMYGNGRKMWTNAIQKDLDRVAALSGAKKTTVFGGKSEKPLPGFARFLFGIPADLPSDLRDWKKIESWAEEMAGEM